MPTELPGPRLYRMLRKYWRTQTHTFFTCYSGKGWNLSRRHGDIKGRKTGEMGGGASDSGVLRRIYGQEGVNWGEARERPKTRSFNNLHSSGHIIKTETEREWRSIHAILHGIFHHLPHFSLFMTLHRFPPHPKKTVLLSSRSWRHSQSFIVKT